MKKLLLAAFALLLTASPALATNCISALPFNFVNGTIADATQVMANFNQIVTGTNTNCASAGSNSDITALNSLSTPITQAGGGTYTYVGGTSTGSANAQVIASLVPANFTLTTGKTAVFIAGFTNTGATQLNVNGTGLTNILKPSAGGAVALGANDIHTGALIVAYYDGTEFILDTNNPTLWGTQASLASAGTTDLGTATSHNISVSGTAAITAFGSTANIAYPFYTTCYTGAASLTYNASSMILPGTANIQLAANDCTFDYYLGAGNWQVLAYFPASGTPQFGPQTSIASATTTDLGTTGSRNVLVTGTTTITSFGNTASVGNPIYEVQFNGALTITQGANILTPGGKNILTAANSSCLMQFQGSSVWRVLFCNNPTIPAMTMVAECNITGTTINYGQGCSSVTNGSAGVYLLTLSQTQANSNLVVLCTLAQLTATTAGCLTSVASASTINVNIFSAGAPTNVVFNIVVFSGN